MLSGATNRKSNVACPFEKSTNLSQVGYAEIWMLIPWWSIRNVITMIPAGSSITAWSEVVKVSFYLAVMTTASVSTGIKLISNPGAGGNPGLLQKRVAS